MNTDAKKIGKVALKVVGAACVATGIVVASAIVASGSAVESVAGGFAEARKAVAKMFRKNTGEETDTTTLLEKVEMPEDAEDLTEGIVVAEEAINEGVTESPEQESISDRKETV